MILYEQRDGFWVPKRDKHCWRATSVEVRDIEVFLRYVDKTRTCIQAGGNFGLFASRYARTFDHVHTFEPDTLNFGCLELNTEKFDNVTRYNCALGDKEGSASLEEIQKDNLGAHQIREGNDFEVKTVDSFDFENVDLIQFDIEGYEQPALYGAEQTILRNKPTIVLELKGIGTQYGYPDSFTFEWLKERGYTTAATIHRDVIFTHE